MSYKGYRNLSDSQIELDSGVNIIYGENAQGKTNFLETVWLLAGGRSFRGTKDSDLIKFGADTASIKGEFFSEERNQSIEIKIKDGARKAFLNEVDRGRASQIVGTFRAVIFSPSHLQLIKGGPDNRRRLIDTIICQLKPTYISVLSRYNQVLRQRNALLKEMFTKKFDPFVLEVWDKKLAEYGAFIVKERVKYVKMIEEKAKAIYQGISGGRENLSLKYSTVLPISEDFKIEEVVQKLKERLSDSRDYDSKIGYTSKGPHRDDIEFFLDGKPVKKFASQGQQRSCVLAVKLAEASVMEEMSGEKPVILFDDVMSELDLGRQNYIMNCINGWQVIITCCEVSVMEKLRAGKLLRIEQGNLAEEKMV